MYDLLNITEVEIEDNVSEVCEAKDFDPNDVEPELSRVRSKKQ